MQSNLGLASLRSKCNIVHSINTHEFSSSTSYLENAAFENARHFSTAFLVWTHQRAFLSGAPKFLSITSRYLATFKCCSGSIGDVATDSVFSLSSNKFVHHPAFFSSPNFPSCVSSLTATNETRRKSNVRIATMKIHSVYVEKNSYFRTAIYMQIKMVPNKSTWIFLPAWNQFDSSRDSHLLHGVDVGDASVGHVALPRSSRPSTRLSLLVDGHFRAIRAKIFIVARLDLQWISRGCRCWGRGVVAFVNAQSKESTHVDDLCPGDVTSVLSQTAQCTLVAAKIVRIVAGLWFLAQSTQVAVGFL